MQKEIKVSELENTINNLDTLEEPLIIKRDSKEDLVVISLEQYKKRIFFEQLLLDLEESEKDLKDGKTYDARKVFKGLREKYDY